MLRKVPGLLQDCLNLMGSRSQTFLGKPWTPPLPSPPEPCTNLRSKHLLLIKNLVKRIAAWAFKTRGSAVTKISLPSYSGSFFLFFFVPASSFSFLLSLFSSCFSRLKALVPALFISAHSQAGYWSLPLLMSFSKTHALPMSLEWTTHQGALNLWLKNIYSSGNQTGKFYTQKQ